MALFFSAVNRSIGGIEIDATISETHGSSIVVTSNPVEFGADINDHRIIQPKTLSIVGRVSDNVLGIEAFTTFFGGSSSRSKGAWQDLITLQETGEPFDVQTGLKLYTSMVLENLTSTQNAKTANVLDFSATIRELRIVATELTTFPPESLEEGATREQGTSGEDRGQVQAQATPPNSSFLNTALGSLGVF